MTDDWLYNTSQQEPPRKSMIPAGTSIEPSPLYWKSQLQTVTATSTKESEYYSTGACARVLVGFRQLCSSLGFTQDSSEIQSNNQPALYSLETRLSHSKSRHIKIQFHYLKDLLRDGELHSNYCPTEDMIADLFTKAKDCTGKVGERKSLSFLSVLATKFIFVKID